MEFELLNKKYNTEFTNKLLESRDIFYEIYAACGNKFNYGCGSYLFDGRTYKYCDLMYEKQELLYNKVKNRVNVLEIGTYMGHSLLIMLLSNPELNITCIDISNTYTLPAVTVLNKHFNNRIKFIHSDSLSALKKMNDRFDFFHVDGHHQNDYISNEFNLIRKMNNSSDAILRILFDDQKDLELLQENIKKFYNVIYTLTPTCSWSNIYFEIQL